MGGLRMEACKEQDSLLDLVGVWGRSFHRSWGGGGGGGGREKIFLDHGQVRVTESLVTISQKETALSLG